MQLNVSGQHVELTSAMQEYVRSKLVRLERHFDHVSNVHVVLSVAKKTHRAEASVNVARGQLHANAQGDDMYAVIDALIDKLDRQIVKHKEKLGDHHRSEGRMESPSEGSVG